jgi:hypothetical protein
VLQITRSAVGHRASGLSLCQNSFLPMLSFDFVDRTVVQPDHYVLILSSGWLRWSVHVSKQMMQYAERKKVLLQNAGLSMSHRACFVYDAWKGQLFL